MKTAVRSVAHKPPAQTTGILQEREQTCMAPKRSPAPRTRVQFIGLPTIQAVSTAPVTGDPADQIHPLTRLWRRIPQYRGQVRRATVLTVLNKVFDIAPE